MVVLQGIVKNGVVVPEQGSRSLPEGAKVIIEYAPASQAAAANPADEGFPLSEEVMKFAGTIKGLPRDFARNHDHYIHGTRKK
jgi:hypothetical protein